MYLAINFLRAFAFRVASSLSSSREDIIKEGGSSRLAREGGYQGRGVAEEEGGVEGRRRKKIDLKKNPGLEGSRLRGSCVNFSEFP